MKIVCAWCGTVISEGTGSFMSHGMCARCGQNPEILQGGSLEEFAESFPFPVVVLNSSLQPVALNRSASETLPSLSSLPGHSTMGAIVECNHSREPEGCGYTVHCTGCVLRNTVTKTNQTGEPFIDVPAKLTSGEEEVFYYISTRKVDGHVVVKMVKPEK